MTFERVDLVYQKEFITSRKFRDKNKDLINLRAVSTVKKTSSNVKKSVNNYKTDIATAYNTGYARGWEDSYKIPQRFGAVSTATYGYEKGITHRRKADKYTQKYNQVK